MNGLALWRLIWWPIVVNPPQGPISNTLTATDMATGWTEYLAVANKSQAAVSQAIAQIASCGCLFRCWDWIRIMGVNLSTSPAPSAGVNDLLYYYCLTKQITFTRSRPYHKNDQAHVEQKNWSVVRHTVGYDRLETSEELALLRSIYVDLRLYINFFQPVLKLIAKEQVDGKTVKKYDQAATPYRRVLALDELPIQTKGHLTNLYISLNPVVLRATIAIKVARLWKIIR